MRGSHGDRSSFIRFDYDRLKNREPILISFKNKMKLVLHGYANSSSAWRIRNVLAIKGVSYKWNEVDILKRIEENKTTY